MFVLNRLFIIFASLAAIVVIALEQTSKAETPFEVRVRSSAKSEFQERDIDAAALDSQTKAIRSIRALLGKYRGKQQEPLLLLKLSESQQQAAGIQYRVAHGQAERRKRAVDLTAYRLTMKELVSNLSEIMKRFPGLEDTPHVLYMRGNAYEELTQVEQATKDYLRLINEFPTSEDYMRGCMALAEIAIKQEDHAKAITFLKRIEKDPTDPHFPFALYKLGWAYYNLRETPRAINYLEQVVSYYDSRKLGANEALRENALLDTTLFTLDAYERGLAGFKIDEILSFFQDIEKGSVLGKMLVRFAKLLRSHSHGADLKKWKDQVLSLDMPASLEVIITTYEFQLNQRQYKSVLESAQDMTKLTRKKMEVATLEHGQRLIMETAEGLQALILKNSTASDVGDLSVILAGVYDAFIRLVDDSDPRIPKVHYNLAEVLFKIHQFDNATKEYRWVVEHTDRNKPEAADASLKAIASRYESLRIRKLIPETLKAKELSSKSGDDLDSSLVEWIGWVDEHIHRYDTVADNFYFEANRSLYVLGRVQKATDRMERFAVDHPSSRFAVSSASLVIDTYVATADWSKLHSIAEHFLKIKEWNGTEFSKRLKVVDFGAVYKIAESDFKEGRFSKSLSRAEESIRKGGGDEFFTLAGKSAIMLHDDKKAEVFFSTIVARSPGSAAAGAAYLNRALLHENKYAFSAAASDYKSYLEQPPKDGTKNDGDYSKLRQRALVLAWLSADASLLGEMLKSKSVCGAELAKTMEVECDKYQALAAGMQGVSSETALSRARKGFSENKAIWATVALMQAKDLGFRDRNLGLRLASTGFDDLDPLVKMALIDALSRSVPEVFALNRKAIESVAPLAGSERHLTHRIDVIHEYENAVTSAAKLPFARLKAAALNQLAWVYVDFAKGLRALPAPKGISATEAEEYQSMLTKILVPFEEKGAEIRGKAFEIATKSSIEAALLKEITEAYIVENPSRAKSMGRVPASSNPNLEVSALANLDLKGEWKSMSKDSDDHSERLRYQWVHAVQKKNWPQATYLLQEASEKSLVSKNSIGFMKSILFAQMGAQAEGLLEFADATKLVAEAGDKK